MSEDRILKYASREVQVLGVSDFEFQLKAITERAKLAGDRRPIEVVIQCKVHRDDALAVIYEDGLIVVGCRKCGKRCGQVEVATCGRPWGRAALN